MGKRNVPNNDRTDSERLALDGEQGVDVRKRQSTL